MVKRTLTVTVDDGSFEVECVLPRLTPAAALVIVPSIFGLNEETDRWLETYSDKGLIAAVYDPFWRTAPGGLSVTDEADRAKARDRRDAFRPDDGVRDLAAAIATVRALDESNGNVAAGGYCFGGRYAMIAAAKLDVQAAVSFHGITMGGSLDAARAIRVPVSFHFGDDDHSTPMSEVREIEAATAGNPNVEIHVYPGVGHSFTWHGHKLHHPAADAESLERALAILTPLGTYQTYASADGTAIASYFTAPEKVRSPAVLMLRGIAGPDDGYTVIADRLAKSGYAALVHRWQVRGNDPSDADLIADIEAAVAFLSTRHDVDAARIAIFGYCKGGGQALVATAALPAIRAVVAFHGFAKRPDGADAAHADPLALVSEISVPVLLLHGEDDQLSPLGSMRELAGALSARPIASGIHTYAGADHGFAVSTHKGYQAAAADDGFARGVAFLSENLRAAS